MEDIKQEIYCLACLEMIQCLHGLYKCDIPCNKIITNVRSIIDMEILPWTLNDPSIGWTTHIMVGSPLCQYIPILTLSN
jgi:hypothetical protein